MNNVKDLAIHSLAFERLPMEHGRYKYYVSNKYEPERYDAYLRGLASKIDREYVEQLTGLEKYFSELELCGPYELKVLQSLLYSKNQLHIILGAMGSGKTSTIQFINEFFNRNWKKQVDNHSVIRINIDLNNAGVYKDETIKRSKSKVFKEIIDEIQMHLTEIYDTNFHGFWVDAFKIASQEKIKSIINFSNTHDILNLSENKFLSNFLKKVKKLSYEDQFKIWIGLLHLHGKKANYKIVLFIDNIDQIGSHLQSRILNDLLAFPNPHPDVKIYVCMRLITLSSIDNLHGNYVHGIIVHSSLLPFQIIELRILDLIKSIMSREPYKNASKSIQLKLFLRALEIIYLIHQNNSNLKKYIDAIGGFSIRRTLRMAQYLFDEDILADKSSSLDFPIFDNNGNILDNKYSTMLTASLVNFSENQFKFDDVLNCSHKLVHLLEKMTSTVYAESKREFNYCKLLLQEYNIDGSHANICIENIYCLSDGKLTMIKLRILHFLYINGPAKIEQIIELINLYSYKAENIVDCINSLGNKDRRLIWFDGPMHINHIDDLFSLNDGSISLTKSGEQYLQFLCYETVYIENMLLYKKTIKPHFALIERLKLGFDLIDDLYLIDCKEFETRNEDLNRTFDVYEEKTKGFLSLEFLNQFLTSRFEILRIHTYNVIKSEKETEFQINSIKNLTETCRYRLPNYQAKYEELFTGSYDKINQCFEILNSIEHSLSEKIKL